MSIPKMLSDRLRLRKVIPFVGAGVSMAVRDEKTAAQLFPSWQLLLLRAADRLEEEQNLPYANVVRALLDLNNPDEYLAAARHAREGLGPIWYTFLKEQLDPARERANDESLNLPRAIWELGSPLVITTNYDRVLHWTSPSYENFSYWDIEAPAEQVNLLRGQQEHPIVWHLHGFIGDATNVILTPDGYRLLYPDAHDVTTKYGAALMTLRTLLASHSFLFIGFSLQDAYFLRQLNDVHNVFHGASGPHYVVISKAESRRIQELNLPVVLLTFQDFGQPLFDLLYEMRDVIAPPAKSVVVSKQDFVSAVDMSQSTTHSPHNPVFFVPYYSKGEHFVGRENTLQVLRKEFIHINNQAIAIQGLGGLGKSQLAVEYAYRYQSAYPNGVIWLNADQDIDAQLTNLATTAKWVAPESNHQHKLETAKHRLKTYSNCLIIFDNVESFESIEPYWPEQGIETDVLITSRNEHSSFIPLQLEPLDEHSALQLLFQSAGQTQCEETELRTAQEATRILGCLPLAIELAGAYIRHRPVGWQQYLDLLKQNIDAALSGRFFNASNTQHESDIHSTLKISEKVFLDAPQLNEVVDLLTWSGPAPMSSSLVSSVINALDSTELTNALGLGVALQLLQRPANSQSYAIHRLVRELRRKDISLASRLPWAHNICKRVADWFQERREDFSNLVVFEAEIDHLQAWKENAILYCPAQVSRLTWLQAYPYFHRGDFRTSKQWIEAALKASEWETEEQANLKANLLSDLGSVTGKLGQYEQSISWLNNALEIRRELLGEQHLDVASTLNSIGMMYGQLSKHKLALEYTEKALRIQESLLNEGAPEFAHTFNSLGQVYFDMGKYTPALELCEKALELHKGWKGEQHPYRSLILNNVAGCLLKLGNHARALEYLEKALILQKVLLGEQHPDIGMILGNIGVCYLRQGMYEKATEYSQSALSISRQFLGDAHTQTLNSAVVLAESLYNTGGRRDAFNLLDEFFRDLPKNHPFYSRIKRQMQQYLATPLREGFRQPSKKRQQKKKSTKKR